MPNSTRLQQFDCDKKVSAAIFLAKQVNFIFNKKGQHPDKVKRKIKCHQVIQASFKPKTKKKFPSGET